VRLHARLFDGVRRGVLIAESLWPNSAYADGRGINTLTGADPVAFADVMERSAVFDIAPGRVIRRG